MSQLAQKREERVVLSAFVDPGLKAKLVERARAHDRSLSALVRRALAHELEREDGR